MRLVAYLLFKYGYTVFDNLVLLVGDFVDHLKLPVLFALHAYKSVRELVVVVGLEVVDLFAHLLVGV